MPQSWQKLQSFPNDRKTTHIIPFSSHFPSAIQKAVVSLNQILMHTQYGTHEGKARLACFMRTRGGLKSKVYLFIRVTACLQRTNWMNRTHPMFGEKQTTICIVRNDRLPI